MGISFLELAPRRKKKFFQPEGCSRLIIELSRNKKGNCTMKSIKQLCQLSDEELKGIVRNDPDISKRKLGDLRVLFSYAILYSEKEDEPDDISAYGKAEGDSRLCR